MFHATQASPDHIHSPRLQLLDSPSHMGVCWNYRDGARHTHTHAHTKTAVNLKACIKSHRKRTGIHIRVQKGRQKIVRCTAKAYGRRYKRSLSWGLEQSHYFYFIDTKFTGFKSYRVTLGELPHLPYPLLD